MAQHFAPLVSLLLAMLLLVLAAAAVLYAPIRLGLTLGGEGEGPTVRTSLSFWGAHFEHSFVLHRPELAAGGSADGVSLSEIPAIWHDFQIYRDVVTAVADAGELCAVSIEGGLGLGDPARTAIAFGLLQGLLAARFGGVARRSFQLTPEWGGWRLHGNGAGIFRWRGVDIMVALVRTLRALGMLDIS